MDLDPTRPPSDRFWELVCGFYGALLALLALNVVLLSLTVFSFVFTPSGSDVRQIIIANLIILAITSSVTLALLVKCTRKFEEG